MESNDPTMPPCNLRTRYGDEIGDIIAAHSTSSIPRADRPAAPVIKARLQAIVGDPESADLAHVDALTRALLMDPAWRTMRIASLHDLTRAQLAECASYALDHFPACGKPGVERNEMLLTLALLAAARGWHAPRRNRLLRQALSQVFQAGYVHATMIIRKAHREWRAVT